MIDNLQLNAEGKLKHFLTIEGLDKSLLTEILDTAESFAGVSEHQVKKVPLLRGKTIVNLFFENSTRTRTTFELAATRLSADVINMNIATSATSKGESLLDTIRNLEAMFVDMFVVRHALSGAAHFIAQQTAPHISVINAGDGQHAHPTQAMLDMFTIRRIKPDFSSLRVAIIGDILHSRVARSEIQALNTLGAAEVRVIAPKTLLPAHVQSLGVSVSHNLTEGLKDIDVVMMLRLQKERMSSALLPSESEYFKCFGLTEEKLKIAKPDAIVMHPGPINRGVEIDSKVADGPQSVILKQVSNGIAVRMAVMAMAMQTAAPAPGRPGDQGTEDRRQKTEEKRGVAAPKSDLWPTTIPGDQGTEDSRQKTEEKRGVATPKSDLCPLSSDLWPTTIPGDRHAGSLPACGIHTIPGDKGAA